MARSYMANEWEVPGDSGKNHDGLSDLFHLFLQNRDQKSSKFNVSSMASSWIGYWLNWVYLRLSLDNSLTGSKANIEAHYDLSNTLYQTFLDKGLMMYHPSLVLYLPLSPPSQSSICTLAH